MFDLIKQNTDIERHIGKYTTLHKAGRLMQGLCPLHGDKNTPSLTIYPDNSFHCFGCHRGGTIIDFEMYRQNITPVEAAKFLCDEYNLHPTYKDSFKFQQNLALRRRKQDWFEGLIGSFTTRTDIYKYIKDRGLSEETIKEFNLGAGQNSNVVVIPINDKFGHVVGFARRNLDPNATEKYLNDSADNIYNKSEILFNLDKAKYHTRVAQAIILNEGYFDTMTLWEAGIKHGMAFCSSRITRSQALIVQSVIDDNCIIYLVPTNDETAQNELEKNLAQIKASCPKNHIRVLVIPPDCKDLNDVLIKYGKEKVVEIYNSSIAVELYLAKRIISTEKIVEQQYLKAKKLCSAMDNNILVEDICRYLAEAWSKSLDTVRSFMLDKKNKDTVEASKFKNWKMLTQEYNEYITTLAENRINFGWHKTDMVTRGMHIGDVVMMIASTGVGKTVWAENLLLNLTKQYPELPMMFFSLEQMGIMAFERFMMMEGQMESREVEKWVKDSDTEVKNKITAALSELSKNFKNFVLVDEGGMDLVKLENFVTYASMSVFSRPVKVVVIDYLGYLQGEGQDLYHKVTAISKQLKELAKKLKCVIICLAQVSKVGKTGGDPIEGYMARDSGVVQESADIMISAWRPELKEGITDSEKADLEGVYMTKIAKNKYGESGMKIEFMFVKKHLKLAERRDSPMQVDEKGKIKG